MSVSGTFCDVGSRRAVETHALLVIIWAATLLAYLLVNLGAGSNFSTDDAMRLVQVRDLIGGQNWFDTTQYRLSPPEGTPMHWSRLIDLPLAALIRGGEMLGLSVSHAEQVVALVWPAGLFMLFLAGIVRLARELADDTAARLALIFAALLVPIIQHFRPDAIDHHNAQLVLLVWALALAVRPTIPAGALAGLCCALSVAIGEEIAPGMAAIAATVGVRWIMHGEAVRPATAAFAVTFAAATLAAFAATVAPSAYAVATCDALSIVHVTAALIGGCGLALLTAVRPLNSIGRRIAGAAMLGGAGAALMVLAFPACLGDPYLQVDPRLAALWLNHVTEARSILSLARDLPQDVLPTYGLIFAALAAGLYRAFRESADARWPWIAGTVVLVPLTLMALWQVRSAAAANAIAAALVPAALVRAFVAPAERVVFLGLGRGALLAALATNPMSLAGMSFAAAGAIDAIAARERPAIIADGPDTCRRMADYAPLARLPRGLVAAFIDAGPYLLLQTPHAALAAPYHRDIKGNAAMFDIFLARPDQASAILSALGVTYIAFCAGSPEHYTYAAAAPDGLAAALGRGEVPQFLDRIPLAGTELALYRVQQ